MTKPETVRAVRAVGAVSAVGAVDVVIAGAGMAAVRLVEQILAHDVDRRLRVTVIGAERQPPYNRVLLSAALTDPRRLDELVLHERQWYRRQAVELTTATRVVTIDRAARTLHCDDGQARRYDRLVLATGANPTLPPIRGIVTAKGKLHPSVTSFRSYDDCRRLLAAAAHARRVVVVGGGVLGLEAARGLASRGLGIDVVHAGPHLLHDHLDADAGELLRRQVEGLGIRVRTGLHVSAVDADGHRLRAARLSDGSRIGCDLAVLACGSRPATRLAVAAGLTTGPGVVVDDQLRSVDDDLVYAIGDCATRRDAEPETGQAWAAWAQADVLARVLLGADARYRGERRAVRLRAAGLEVAAIGEPMGSASADTEVVRVHNPARGSYKRLAFRHNRLVGGVLVGDASGAATLAAALDRPWLHASPAALLLGAATASARQPDSAALADETTICACNGVDTARVRAAARHHAGAGENNHADTDRIVAAVVDETRATTGCGGCGPLVRSIVGATLAAVATPARQPPA